MVFNRFFNFFRTRQLDDDIREELEFHRSQTSGRFGNVTLIHEEAREASTLVWLETLAQDLRYGVRQLLKTPVLLIVAALSLALGIGANTAVFTLINAVMLQSLPVRDPGRLVLFFDGISSGVYSGDKFQNDIFSYPSWEYLNAHKDLFDGLCAFKQGSDRVTLHVAGAASNGPGERAEVRLVSGNYFNVLGVSAAAGRVLEPEDDTPTASPAAVISYAFWQRRFQLDKAIIGKTAVLNGATFAIAGVAAPEFFGERIETPPDFWLPLSFQPAISQSESSSLLKARDHYWLNFMGRLKPGATIRGAEAAVDIRLRQFYMEQSGAHPSPAVKRQLQSLHVTLKPGGGGISGLRFLYSEPLHVLMAVVGLVLLIACANIATLLLARASARRHEFLARLALGASRSRLLRQVLTESMLLSMIGGALGVGIAWWSVRGLVLLLHVNPVVKVRPDPVVLLFTVAISVLSGIVFGIIPALRFSGMEPRPISAGASAGLGKVRFGSVHALIVLQVALSLVLLLGAGLLTHSLLAMQHQDLGFKRDNVLLVKTDPRLAGYKREDLALLYREIDARVNGLPGVVSASVARYTPQSGSSSSSNIAIQGYTAPAGKNMDVFGVEVGPRFFETLEIPLLLGRTLGPQDTPASPQVAVVTASFVKTFLPDVADPVGQRFTYGSPFKAPGIEIVGVVGDTKYFDVREKAKPIAFTSLWQLAGFQAYAGEVVVRTSRDSAGVAAQVRRALTGINSKLPILEVTTLDNQIEQSLNQQKMITGLCSAFGTIAVLLAAIGVYGTVAYAVTRRTTEIGIRMAVGARHGDVLWMMLRDSVALIALGLALGLPLALAGTRSIKGFLYGVTTADPAAIGAAVLLIALLALLAAYLPARRATKVDPISALRYE